jgi:threonyl-tRNA synthetase
MRLLLIHSDFIEYEAKKKTGMAEEGADLTGSQKDGLTVFSAVEAGDEEDIDDVVAQAANEVKKTADQLGVSRVMIYPYAHLSPDLAKPETAIDALRKLESTLKEEGYEVKRAPFGWYKSFRISCKGHPLSELSKTIVPGEEKKTAPKKEVTHEFFVLTPDGERHDVRGYRNSSITSRYPMSATCAGCPGENSCGT